MIEQNVILIVVGLFLALTWRDLFSPTPSGQVDKSAVSTPPRNIHDHYHHMDLDDLDDPTSRNVYEPQMSANTLAGGMSHPPTIKILYCHSCGYKNAFDETSKLLRQKYPDFRIIGGLHQPSWLRNQIVQLIFLFKSVSMALILFNINPFNYFGMATPQIWTYIMEHKMYASMMIFFLTQTIEAQLMSTGAFEIFYNDMPIWSKIESGRMPSPFELIQVIDSQTSFNPRSKLMADFSPPA